MLKNKSIIGLIIAMDYKNDIIPQKNIKPLNGKPLCMHPFDLLLKSNLISEIVFLSNKDEIINLIKNKEYKNYKSIKIPEKTKHDEIINLIKNKYNNDNYIIVCISTETPFFDIPFLEHSIQTSIQEDCNINIFTISPNTNANIRILNNRANKTVDITAKQNELLPVTNYYEWNTASQVVSQKIIGINVIGNNQTGLGHIYRQLTIALYLNTKPIFFIHKKQDIAFKKIQNHNYPYVVYETNKELMLYLKKYNIQILINDILDTKKNFIKNIKYNGIKVVNFEDLGTGAKEADRTINSLYEFSKDNPNIYYGYKYVCLRPDVLFAPQKKITEKMNNILITCGGIDKNNLTQKYLNALTKLNFKGKITIVLGIGYQYINKLKKEIKRTSLDIKMYQDIKTMADFILNADLVLTSNGRTIYEIGAIGTPCISVSNNEREMHHSFARISGCISNLGLAYNVEEAVICKEINKYIRSYTFRKSQNRIVLKYNIKDGVKRVINIIKSL